MNVAEMTGGQLMKKKKARLPCGTMARAKAFLSSMADASGAP